MKYLFLTQSKSLSLFYNMGQLLTKEGLAQKVAYYISDSSYYRIFRQQCPQINESLTLKEWDIIQKASQKKPDLNKLKQMELQYGDPQLWDAIVADRRLYLGKKATLVQDYTRRFSDDELLSILQTAIEEMEAFFDQVKPDVVVSFICVTIGDYLAHLICQSRGIEFINLRPTRIKNYFFGGESVHEPSDKLKIAYQNLLSQGLEAPVATHIAGYLDELRGTHAMYEGVIPASAQIIQPKIKGKSNKLKRIQALWSEFKDYHGGEFKFDNAYRGLIYPILAQKWILPNRAKKINHKLSKNYINTSDLDKIEYTFYPLHKEPEVTLLVYGRPYLNQIEVIRNLARSLPVGMKLIVKEHPAALGYRKLSYYKKLLEIPNVILANPSIPSRDLVMGARLVAIISGSVGLEAIMMKKPVIAFGRTPFGFLPESMIKTMTDLNNLSKEILNKLNNYQHDEKALSAYIAAVMQNSVAVDFYSVLLGRSGVYSPNNEIDHKEDIYYSNLKILTKYLVKTTQIMTKKIKIQIKQAIKD